MTQVRDRFHGRAEELPWEWFDFLELPRMVGKGIGDSVEEGGAGRVWKVVVDGRVVPFKLLRRRASGGGVRPLLVMLHGMGLLVSSFHGVAGWLFATHDLALVDYSTLTSQGLFSSDGWPRGGVGIKVMAEAVWPVADAAGVERVDLAGNSLGGVLCLVAALQRPLRVRRLVLSNPACYPQRLPLMYRITRVPLVGEMLMGVMGAEKLVGGVEHIGYVNKLRFERELRERYLASLGGRQNRCRLMEMIRHLPQGETDMTVAGHVGRLKDIYQPVMLTWGEQDSLLTEGAGDRLAGDLGNCVFRRYGDLAHMPHEEAPERVGREWAGFLNADGG